MDIVSHCERDIGTIAEQLAQKIYVREGIA